MLTGSDPIVFGLTTIRGVSSSAKFSGKSLAMKSGIGLTFDCCESKFKNLFQKVKGCQSVNVILTVMFLAHFLGGNMFDALSIGFKCFQESCPHRSIPGKSTSGIIRPTPSSSFRFFPNAMVTISNYNILHYLVRFLCTRYPNNEGWG